MLSRQIFFFFFFFFLEQLTNIFSLLFQKSSPFGLLFDIDGVLVRGKNVLPSVPECFQRLVDSNGNFRIPTVIVTNAGNALRSAKAEQLTQWLGVKVSELLTGININNYSLLINVNQMLERQTYFN